MAFASALSNFFRSAFRSDSRSASSLARCFAVIGFASGRFRILGMVEL